MNENVYSSGGGGKGFTLGAVILLIKSFRMFSPLQFEFSLQQNMKDRVTNLLQILEIPTKKENVKIKLRKNVRCWSRYEFLDRLTGPDHFSRRRRSFRPRGANGL